MNYWLNIRLKIRDFFRKHKKKIIIGLIIWGIIIAINYFLKNQEEIEIPISTYEPHNPVIDTKDDVPETYKQPINNLIDNYINYCNNKEYESAYDLLSEEYKNIYCKSIETFKNYVDKKFDVKKIYNIQNYSNVNNTYVYRIRIMENILATGTTDKYEYVEEKIAIKEENGVLKLSLGGYCGSKELNIETENEYVKTKIVKKDMTYDEETYTIEFTNKSSYYIVISDNTETDEIMLQLTGEKRKAKNLLGGNIVVLPGGTETIQITFDKYFDDEDEPSSMIFNAIRVLPKFSGLISKAETEKKDAIKLYSLTINLKPDNK